MKRSYTFPFGVQFANRPTFRLWAPAAPSVDLLLRARGSEDENRVPMKRAEDGFFTLDLPGAQPGDLYRFLVNGRQSVPDPASRFQPQDAHGPSEIIDPCAYAWENDGWSGIDWEACTLYELHLGTFTEEGTFSAAAAKLPHLKAAGVTAVELMPVADFPGRRSWGYDGVLPYAPDSSYGRPEDMKRFVDAAHGLGMAVFLDVVYNHFGPDGNYLRLYAPTFFTDEVTTPWGDAIDFRQRRVRDFYINNALYWLSEYFIDGLRFDAVHAIHDPTADHVLNELARTVRKEITDHRVHLVLENDKNQASLLNPKSEDRFTAQWNDDFHHVAHCLATGESAGYYADYAKDSGRLLATSLTEGFVFQGDPSPFRGGELRGEPSANLPPTVFVNFLQNHDQVGNRAFGDRLAELADPAKIEALICIVWLSPHIPMLFMGEEWGTRTPFQYFCDFHDQLADAVREGRRREFASFPQFCDPESRSRIPDPNAVETFMRSKLRWEELQTPAASARLKLHSALAQTRTVYLVGRMSGAQVIETAVLDRSDAARISWRLSDGALWSLAYNLSDKAYQLPGADGDSAKLAGGRRLRASPVFSHPASAASELTAGPIPPLAVAAFHAAGEESPP